MSKLFESKTNTVLIFLAILALIVCVAAAAIFGESLWREFFDLLKIQTGGSVVRAATNDGLPKAVTAYRNHQQVEVISDSPLPISQTNDSLAPFQRG